MIGRTAYRIDSRNPVPHLAGGFCLTSDLVILGTVNKKVPKLQCCLPLLYRSGDMKSQNVAGRGSISFQSSSFYCKFEHRTKQDSGLLVSPCMPMPIPCRSRNWPVVTGFCQISGLSLKFKWSSLPQEWVRESCLKLGKPCPADEMHFVGQYLLQSKSLWMCKEAARISNAEANF